MTPWVKLDDTVAIKNTTFTKSAEYSIVHNISTLLMMITSCYHIIRSSVEDK